MAQAQPRPSAMRGLRRSARLLGQEQVHHVAPMVRGEHQTSFSTTRADCRHRNKQSVNSVLTAATPNI
jgi:hypothetical protein